MSASVAYGDQVLLFANLTLHFPTFHLFLGKPAQDYVFSASLWTSRRHLHSQLLCFGPLLTQLAMHVTFWPPWEIIIISICSCAIA
jgi:hypothetical protein